MPVVFLLLNKLQRASISYSALERYYKSVKRPLDYNLVVERSCIGGLAAEKTIFEGSIK